MVLNNTIELYLLQTAPLLPEATVKNVTNNEQQIRPGSSLYIAVPVYLCTYISTLSTSRSVGTKAQSYTSTKLMAIPIIFKFKVHTNAEISLIHITLIYRHYPTLTGRYINNFVLNIDIFVILYGQLCAEISTYSCQYILHTIADISTYLY